ncbi:monosaccharide ABC transporter ATP-binding protein, CUT2 family [Pseudorhodobacter antarcticus]|uniref:Monosaccharide ABC transporter ATP-binding protein, CUT2 family n=1 Tax=Pseudorhodobacter antarcticus TaxID=1077947 RepID=A0A1H8IRF0_9RHOB|nr:sugar ABC transporter ATP-binding protein [Pseudorhodobacter antarcticus]SEN70961.1 monosaccharide ABC transporter ATP-binding protein, CUT2 family [Pseudorhodobacter antarcticus]
MTTTDGLFFDRIVKSFGGTQALRGVSLRVERGEIVALLGENGAGKSTLIKVLGGIHAPDTGTVSVDGKRYDHVAGKVSQKQAVAFIHQDLGLIEWMSVAENIALAIGYARKGGRINWRGTEDVARRALALVDADFAPTTRVSNLSRTEKSLVAIARALAVECDFLVLDEPTASLPADEVDRLFSALRPLKAKGVGMIYVSHRLDEIFQIADRVAVLRDGQMVGMRDIQHTTAEELVGLIVGRKAREINRPDVQAGDAILTVQNLKTPNVGPVSFDVKCGELVGLVGLRGAGHEDVGRSLFGLCPHDGQISLEGHAPNLATPRAAMLSGIGFVARDRVVESIAPSLTIRENAFLNPAATGRGLLNFLGAKAENIATRALGTRVGLSPNDPTLAIEALSGGNQQKIVVGRWLDTNRRFLIAEDPTAGVDVGAKAEIYHLLFNALASGMGVLVVSTDFEEIANICHRAIVFSRGQVVAELSGVGLSTESLIQAASASEVA